MLLGEHLRGRHQHRLFASPDGAQHRGERHHGFAGPHLALEQALHRPCARHIGVNVSDYLLLPLREAERQGVYEPLLHIGIVRRIAHKCLAFARVSAFAQQRDLRYEGLFITQCVNAALKFVRGGGIVHGAECFGAVQQTVVSAQAVADDVGNGAG